MAVCKYHQICGLDDKVDPVSGLCILHSQSPDKDKQSFVTALEAHRKKNGNNFTGIVFPVHARFHDITFTAGTSFERAAFTEGADFSLAKFGQYADFQSATFTRKANFFMARFEGWVNFRKVMFADEAAFLATTFNDKADFEQARFVEEANFLSANFAECTNFDRTTFSKEACFSAAKFTKDATFFGAKFSSEANFEQTQFNVGRVDFRRASFGGRTLFSSRRNHDQTIAIFSGVEVDFMQVLIDAPHALTFLEADLRKCRFLDTDLRKVEFTGVDWTKIGGRSVVYDEIVPLQAGEARPWARIERLYRELKQNYEDRRDYERAGDFHYGEKEMRRRNPETPFILRFLLTFYWLFSGYGERYLRPLIWAGLLLAASTIGYLALGLSSKGGESTLALTNGWDWLRAAFYSFRVMTFLKPDDLIPIGCSKVVNTIESLLGPLLLGLFALAVRQRLKR